MPVPRRVDPRGSASTLPAPPRSPFRHRLREHGPVVACTLGIVAALAPLIPAFQGQKVGDPDTVAFWLEVAAGMLGGPIAAALGAVCIAAGARERRLAVAAVALPLGGFGFFMGFALFFSG